MVSAILNILNKLLEVFKGITRQNKIKERKDEAEAIKRDPGSAWAVEFGVRNSDVSAKPPGDTPPSSK